MPRPSPKALNSLRAPQSYFRIYLRRSAIGLPAKQAGVLDALGLRRRTATVYHPVTPDVAGQIFRVKELVDVEEVDRPLDKKEIKARRTPATGYYVESRAGSAWADE